MKRPEAAYVLDPDAFARIYGAEQRAIISSLTIINDRPTAADQIGAGGHELAQVEVVLSGWGAPRMDGPFLDRVPNLRAVLYGSGTVRGVVTPEVARRGIQVTSAVTGNSVPVADFTVAAVYFSLKRLWPVLRGSASEVDAQTISGDYRSTIGFVGLGAVGRLACQRFRGTDLELVAYDPNVVDAEAKGLGIHLVGLDELFATSDVVSVHAALLPSTRGLVTAGLVASMKPFATLINTARGAILEEAVISVLAERLDLHAVLDVTDPEPLPNDSPVRSMVNVTLTPHVAGSMGRECQRMGDMMIAELRRYIAGEPFRWAVRLEDLDLQDMSS